MAITRRHTDPVKHYEAEPWPKSELTNSQRERFSKVANRAEDKREKRAVLDGLFDLAKQRTAEKAMLERPTSVKPMKAPVKLSPKKAVIWLLKLVVACIGIWLLLTF